MYNLTYKIKENGYEIYNDGKLWITQYEPNIPNPSLSYEENAKQHIEELSIKLEDNKNLEYKVEELEQEVSSHDETISLLTYELMIIQEPIGIVSLSDNNSPKFDLIKSWYNKGYWTEEMLLNTVKKKYITEVEMNEIIG